MTLSSILLFIAFAILFRLLARPAWKGWVLYAASILAVYWLQPATPVRYLDFWFPTLTLGLAVLGWVLTRTPTVAAQGGQTPIQAGQPTGRANIHHGSLTQNLPAAAVLAGMVLLVGLTRFLNITGLIVASRPPAFEQVALAVVLIAGLALGLGWLVGRASGRAGANRHSPLLWGASGVLVALLVLLKAPGLALGVSAALRDLMNQSTALAAAGDLRWLGFSYVAFRLIHTLRDRQTGRLPAVSLQEYLVYVLFFPAFTAGPIDRLDRFIKDLRAGEKPIARPMPAGPEANPAPAAAASSLGIVAPAVRPLVFPQVWPEWAAAGQRLTLGLFKKFVLADGLALMALNATNATQVNSAGWAWTLLIAYSLQIYFDFSGYTDIAIGLGRLLGINLPENFNAPYLKANLTLFWNNWHMTLTNWFRAYYFNPVTRWLRMIKRLPPVFKWLQPPTTAEDEAGGISPALIIFFTQLSTFILIGLWHGVTWNFVLWGAWHGLGLFAQNRWSEAMRPRYAALQSHPRLGHLITGFSTLLTFIYVALGWVFFALPDPSLSFRVLGKLFGN